MAMVLRILRAIGARSLTVLLMGVLSAAMALITVIEAIENTREVPYDLYLSPWFIGLLMLAWFNLACNAAFSSWWTWRKVPGMLTHLGILLILMGGFFTWKLGIRGSLPVDEGKTQWAFMADSPVLRVSVSPEAGLEATDHEFFVLSKDGVFTRGSALAALNPLGVRRALTSTGMPLVVRDVAPSSRAFMDLEDSGQPAGLPGIVVTCKGAKEQRLVLLKGRVVPTGEAFPWHVAYYHAGTGQDPRDIVLRAFGEWIEIAPPDGPAARIPIVLPADAGRELTEGNYRVKVLKYYPNFKMGKEPVPDEPALNPAVKLHVAGPGGEQDVYAFAFHEFHGSRLDDGAEIRYLRPREHLLVLVSHHDGVVESYAQRDAAPSPFGGAENVGVVFDVSGGAGPVQRCTLRLEKYVASAREVERLEPAPAGNGPPGFLVALGEGGAPVWLFRDYGAATSPDGRATAAITNAFPLGGRVGERYDPAADGFSLTLEDAVARHWPGSGIPRAYFSLVQIADAGGRPPRRERIETNAPLYHQGFRLYQSGMDDKPPFRSSSFAVAYDPGVPLVAAGFYVLMAGLLWVTATHFVLKSRARSGAEKEVRA